jgi:hypothetical protein
MSRVVPVQSDVNTNRPLFAALGSGGGGGTDNPDPSFSSIRIAAGAFGNLTTSTGVIVMSNILNITTAPVLTPTTLYRFPPVLTVGDSTTPDLAQVPFSTNYIQVTSPITTTDPGVFLNLGATLGAGTFIASARSDTGAPSTLSLIADGVNISSLNVSSINGATPGGGGALSPDITVSTLTFPRSNQVSRGVINISSLLTVQDTSTPSTAQFFFAANNTENIFSGGFHNSFLMYSPADVTRVALSASQDGNGYLSAFNNLGSTSALYISCAVVNVPGNLNVSSINGVIPLTGADTSTLTGQMREVRSTLGLI